MERAARERSEAAAPAADSRLIACRTARPPATWPPTTLSSGPWRPPAAGRDPAGGLGGPRAAPPASARRPLGSRPETGPGRPPPRRAQASNPRPRRAVLGHAHAWGNGQELHARDAWRNGQQVAKLVCVFWDTRDPCRCRPGPARGGRRWLKTPATRNSQESMLRSCGKLPHVVCKSMSSRLIGRRPSHARPWENQLNIDADSAESLLTPALKSSRAGTRRRRWR